MTNVTRVGVETVFDFIDPHGHRLPVDVELTYRADDPHAVTLVFHSAGGTTWLVGRDLLAHGLVTTSGLGDVRIRPHTRNVTLLELSCGDLHAMFHVRTAALRSFLDATYDVVALGDEERHLDVDSVLRKLLA